LKIKTDDAVATRNALWGQVVCQEGSLHGRYTGVCRRQVGQMPPYVPCITGNAVGAPAGTAHQYQWYGGTVFGGGLCPVAITLADWTAEWFFQMDGGSVEQQLQSQLFTAFVGGGLDWVVQRVGGSFAASGSAGAVGGAHDTWSLTPFLSPGGHYFALQAAAGLFTVVLDGVAIRQVARAGGAIVMPTPSTTGVSLLAYSGAGETADCIIHQYRISNVGRYATWPYTPPVELGVDASALFCWRMEEGGGSKLVDAANAWEIDFQVTGGDAPYWAQYPYM